ncbi:uncharacterized protein LOC114315832 [Camellia sinensis]|uniref:uncharacterized protein LOC114315832 n=1 Tax=Camellia sinensis TaxID=4442 RepID=UPI0010359829|nr:uncharacterized protein LOC114315832 [Camellia sinensis]
MQMQLWFITNFGSSCGMDSPATDLFAICKTSIPDLLHTFEKPDPCHTARIFKACIVVEFEMRWIYLSGINGGMEPPEEPPAVNFAFVSSVLLPNGTPDVHFRVACGGQKLRDIMLDSNIELYGPYSRPLLNCGGGGTCGTCIVENVAWFPLVTEFQTRLLFNQAFSRGLQIQRILAGGKKQKQK